MQVLSFGFCASDITPQERLTINLPLKMDASATAFGGTFSSMPSTTSGHGYIMGVQVVQSTTWIWHQLGRHRNGSMLLSRTTQNEFTGLLRKEIYLVAACLVVATLYSVLTHDVQTGFIIASVFDSVGEFFWRRPCVNGERVGCRRLFWND